MSRFVNGVVLGVVVFVLVLSAYFYAEQFRGPEQIRAERVESEWGSVDAQSTEIRTTVTFGNPHRAQAQLTHLDYEVLIDGERLDGGTRFDPLVIPASSNETLAFSTQFATSFVIEWLGTYARGGENSELVVRGEAVFSTGGQNVRVPFGSQSSFQSSLLGALGEGVGNCDPQPSALCLLSGEPDWVTTSNQGAAVKLLVTLKNPESRAAELRDVTARILLEDLPVAEGGIPGPIVVGAQSERDAEILLVFDDQALEAWWPRHVSQCERSSTRLDIGFTLVQRTTNDSEAPSSTALVEWRMPGNAYMTQFLCGAESHSPGSAETRSSALSAAIGNPPLAAAVFEPLGVGVFGAAPWLPAVQFPSGDFLRTLMGNAALLLIVGGLAMLGLIVLLLLLQSLFPSRPLDANGREPEPLRPQLRPLGPGVPAPEMSELSRRLRSGKATRRPVVDEALDQIFRLRVGEPRLLRHRPHYSLVRVYECRTCTSGHAHRPFRHKVEGCAFERSAVENAFQGTFGEAALAREVACRMRGDSECEYEVRH